MTTGRARFAACLLASMLLVPAYAGPMLTPPAGAGTEPAAPWHVVGLPGQTKPFTRFSVVDIDARRAVKIEADKSYGNLVLPLNPLRVPAHLAWQWRVERGLAHADLHRKSGDDTAVKVCVFFDEPMSALSFVDRQLIRLARARASEPLPTATVCYVWDYGSPAGSEIDNAFTRRLRYIVLENSSAGPRWAAERRDLGADFILAFGSESADVPAIVGIAIGADADNTKDHSIAYVSGLSLEP
ncbi:MAG: DUF3047 domain-containing protein [Pseudomonadota bacterium]|nr:DUF3047 domain-containing protein [Pseudomonadota bacterium]